MRRFTLLAAALTIAAPASGHSLVAQGTVSAQGLGYPPGQLSTWSLATGGAMAELDPATPVNPAAISLAGTTTLFGHYAPESRRVSVNGARGESRLSRFPLVGAVLPVGQRGFVGIAASTLLDRSWATVRTIPTVVGDEEGAGLVETFQSTGGITDIRGAASWSFTPRLHLGAAAHVYTGENRMTVTRIDNDGIEADFEQTSLLTYTGLGGSAGVVWAPSRVVSVGVSGQVGGTIRAKLSDSVIATATAPARGGATVRLTLLTGAAISARAEWQGWSSLADLGREGFAPKDGWSYSLGADIDGPSVFSMPLMLRLGGGVRDLPFQVLDEQPRETNLSGGFGLPLARNRVVLDFATRRSVRTAGDARETAWTYGVGLTVRP